jgi:hypothetical protein
MKGTFGLGYKSQKYKFIHLNFPKIRSKFISPETIEKICVEWDLKSF